MSYFCIIQVDFIQWWGVRDQMASLAVILHGIEWGVQGNILRQNDDVCFSLNSNPFYLLANKSISLGHKLIGDIEWIIMINNNLNYLGYVHKPMRSFFNRTNWEWNKLESKESGIFHEQKLTMENDDLNSNLNYLMILDGVS